MIKICKDCHLEKSLNEFHKDSKNSDRLRKMCKKCDNIRRENHKKNNYEQTKKNARKNAATRRKKYPEKVHNQLLLAKYGISLEEYNIMFKNQNYKCKICKKEPYIYDKRINGIKKLAVDHCHETGKIRGLLCDNCNHGLGVFKDNICNLENAIVYLKMSKLITDDLGPNASLTYKDDLFEEDDVQ